MPVWLSIVLAGGGVALAGYWVRLLLGRTAPARAWARRDERSVTNAMCGVPAVSLGLVAAARVL